MDPQQRLFLHAAYQALENSGYVSGTTPSTQPDRVGCYVGVATDDYMLNLREHKDVYYSSGLYPPLCSWAYLPSDRIPQEHFVLSLVDGFLIS